MFYNINRIEDIENGDTIVESLRRADSPVGKAQAFREARRMSTRHKGNTILVEKVVSQSITEVVAYAGACEDTCKDLYPDAENLNNNIIKIKSLKSLFDKTVERVANDLGIPILEAKQTVIGELSKQELV